MAPDAILGAMIRRASEADLHDLLPLSAGYRAFFCRPNAAGAERAHLDMTPRGGTSV